MNGIVVEKYVRESTQLNVPKAFIDALNNEVMTLVKKAESRALGNKRKTIKPEDL